MYMNANNMIRQYFVHKMKHEHKVHGKSHMAILDNYI